MATAVAASLKEVDHSLRPLKRLIRFLTKYPPSQFSALATGQAIPTSTQRKVMDAKPLSSTSVPKAKSIPSARRTPLDTAETTEFSDMIPGAQAQEVSESSSIFPPNPFLPYRNPASGRWRGARVGLREQADLFKYAQEHGCEELLPPSIKSSSYKQRRALERGLAVKGTGEGQQVKGHKWERTMASTLEKRRKAMEEMPQLIRDWEARGHGRGWKKYPK